MATDAQLAHERQTRAMQLQFETMIHNATVMFQQQSQQMSLNHEQQMRSMKEENAQLRETMAGMRNRGDRQSSKARSRSRPSLQESSDESENDDDSDEEDDMIIKLPKEMSTAKINGMMTDMKPGSLGSWQAWNRNGLTSNARRMRVALKLNETEFVEMLRGDKELRVQDEALANTLKACMKESTYVKNFKADLLRKTQDELSEGSTLPPVNESGYRLWYAMKASEEAKDGGLSLSRVDAFNMKQYLSMSMSHEQLVEASDQMHADYMLLPEDERDATPQKMFLNKLPTELEDSAKAYRTKMLQRKQDGKPPKHTYSRLVEHFAIEIATARINRPSMGNVNATFTNKPYTPPFTPTCAICDSPDHRHDTKDQNGDWVCKVTCSVANGGCGERTCTGCRPNATVGFKGCCVHANPFPPREECRNAHKKPIPETIYSHLKKLNQKWLASQGGTSANVNRQEMGTSTADDDIQEIVTHHQTMLSYMM
jgi:hypothetical protein